MKNGQSGIRNAGIILILLMGWSARTSFSQSQDLGQFEGHADVGDVKQAGSVTYDADAQSYVIEGAGATMEGDHDAFQLVWKRMTGDFILRARARFHGDGVEPDQKMGWAVRASLDPGAAYADVVVQGDGRTALQVRRSAGDSTDQIASFLDAPDVIQLERKGQTYIMSIAHAGEPFVTNQLSLDLGDEVYVGLFVGSHDEDVTARATFDNVRIVVPAPDDFVPYRDYIGSNLEVMDVETGDRRIVYRHPESLQAPNWTPDGRTLIYNHNGLLYTFDLETRTPEVLNTDFATRNNNDHVLSFDGTMLGISHHAEEADGASIIYTMPVEGGTPQRVTEKGPSYLHGWSPDGQYLIYTGGRDGEYDIYRISVDGGEETNLTSNEGLDDGSEYAPDGRHIYFNSLRSGSMEIWRMEADGNNPEQITDDEYQNWFPHISPDGTKMVFLSYPKTVDPADHPFYQRVYLRLMPIINGKPQGTPKVIAYVYGGQGTINVPSWSPDSRRIAFVSNTVL